VETVLARASGRWPRIRDAPDAYLRRMLACTYLSWWRRRWRGEVPLAAVPDGPAGPVPPDAPDGGDVRVALAGALARLPR
jgi:DNA-directed RNA polymerase specialized sigma24 family protein